MRKELIDHFAKRIHAALIEAAPGAPLGITRNVLNEHSAAALTQIISEMIYVAINEQQVLAHNNRLSQ